MAAVDADGGIIASPEKRRLSEVRKGFTSFTDGDVLFAKITPCMENGKSAIAAGLNNAYGFGSTEFHVLRPESGILSEWLFYFVRQASFRRRAKANFAGTAGQLRVPTSFLEAHPVPLPPLAEQQRIVAEIEKQLTRLGAGVAALKRARAALRRYRASVLKAACEGKLVPQDPSDEPADQLLRRILGERRAKWEADLRAKGKDPSKAKYEEPVGPATAGLGALPVGWEWASLSQLLEAPLTNGRSVKDYPGGFPVLRLNAIRKGNVDLTQQKAGAWTREEANAYLVHAHDFLVARGNGSLDLVGQGGLVREGPGDVAFPDTMIRVRVNPSLFNPDYLRTVWNAPFIRKQVETSARTTAGIYKINQQLMHRFILPLPPLAEQERIVAEVERRLSVVEEMEATVEANLKRAERLRQSILKRAFEGKLVAQDPADEPASVLLERIRAGRGQRV